MRQVTWVIMMVVLCAGSAFGQATSTAPRTAREIQDAIRELEKSSDVAKKEHDLNDELMEISKREARRQADVQRQLVVLRKSKEYLEYQAQQAALRKEANAAWETEHTRRENELKQSYMRRHAELLEGAFIDVKLPAFDGLDFPRIDSSTSTHPLAVVLASRVLGSGYKWEYSRSIGRPWGTLRYDRYLQLDDVQKREQEKDLEYRIAGSRLRAAGQEPAAQRKAQYINDILAVSSNTHGAYLRLADGLCDLNITVRAPSPDELAYARERAVEYVLEPIARDALIFLVNEQNEVRNLTQEQVVGMYRETIKTWNQVGGVRAPVRALWREPNSGSAELIEQKLGLASPFSEEEVNRLRYIMGNKWMYAFGMEGPYNEIASDRHAIGFSVWYFEHYLAMGGQTRVIAVDGIEPTPQAIASGKYPLVFPVYAAMRKGTDPLSPAGRLVQWLKSDEGQKIVRESGYVGLK